MLYRKKDDESLVILKEINMHELSYTERQLALNEVHKTNVLDIHTTLVFQGLPLLSSPFYYNFVLYLGPRYTSHIVGQWF